MPRPIAFNREEKLKQAMQLFWKKGYDGTSVQDLVNYLQINKFSIYNTFGDKQSLYHQALQYYGENISAKILAPLRNKKETGLAKVHLYFDNLINQLCHEGGIIGCFMQNAGLETSLKDETVASMLRDLLYKTEQLIHDALVEAVKTGELSSTDEYNTVIMARLLVTQAQGLIVYRKAVKDPSQLKMQIDLLLDCLRLNNKNSAGAR